MTYDDNKLFIGRSLTYQAAIAEYRRQIKQEIDEGTFYYCPWSGKATAEIKTKQLNEALEHG